MEGILYVLKSGELNDELQYYLRTLTKYLKGKKGKKYFTEEHIVESVIEEIMNMLYALRFVLFFIGESYSDAFGNINGYIDRFALPSALLETEKLKEFKDFFNHLFSAHLNEELKKTLKDFSAIEIARLDEALNTLIHEAYFSSVVMSVSAVESRLHNIIRQDKPVLYKRDKLGDSPLGHLLNKVNSDKKYSVIKSKFSDKYSYLLQLCNNYRIFSAHPKNEIMRYQDALSIFGLSMSFLLMQWNQSKTKRNKKK